MTDQQAKETYFSRILLDSKNREFICDDQVKETYGKGYNYKDYCRNFHIILAFASVLLFQFLE